MFIQIAIGDVFQLKVKIYKGNGSHNLENTYYEKTAVKNDWNEQPTDRYIIRVEIDSSDVKTSDEID